MTYRFENCKVERVIDGDTVVITIDVGFYLITKQSFRLNRINAPETRTKDKEEKRKGLIAEGALEGMIGDREVIVETHKAGKFGRWLAEIYVRNVEGEPTNINDLMVEEGYAEYKDY